MLLSSITELPAQKSHNNMSSEGAQKSSNSKSHSLPIVYKYGTHPIVSHQYSKPLPFNALPLTKMLCYFSKRVKKPYLWSIPEDPQYSHPEFNTGKLSMSILHGRFQTHAQTFTLLHGWRSPAPSRRHRIRGFKKSWHCPRLVMANESLKESTANGLQRRKTPTWTTRINRLARTGHLRGCESGGCCTRAGAAVRGTNTILKLGSLLIPGVPLGPCCWVEVSGSQWLFGVSLVAISDQTSRRHMAGAVALRFLSLSVLPSVSER